MLGLWIVAPACRPAPNRRKRRCPDQARARLAKHKGRAGIRTTGSMWPNWALSLEGPTLGQQAGRPQPQPAPLLQLMLWQDPSRPRPQEKRATGAALQLNNIASPPPTSGGATSPGGSLCFCSFWGGGEFALGSTTAKAGPGSSHLQGRLWPLPWAHFCTRLECVLRLP